LIKTSGDQTAALEELQKVAKENSENMSRVCTAGSLHDQLAVAPVERAFVSLQKLNPRADIPRADATMIGRMS
jgi:hypothetical protein